MLACWRPITGGASWGRHLINVRAVDWFQERHRANEHFRWAAAGSPGISLVFRAPRTPDRASGGLRGSGALLFNARPRSNVPGTSRSGARFRRIVFSAGLESNPVLAAQDCHCSHVVRNAAFASSSVSAVPLVRSPERGSTYSVMDQCQMSSGGAAVCRARLEDGLDPLVLEAVRRLAG
jgi:hypothetical protein